MGGCGYANFGLSAVRGEVVPVFAVGVDMQEFSDGDFIQGRKRWVYFLCEVGGWMCLCL